MWYPSMPLSAPATPMGKPSRDVLSLLLVLLLAADGRRPRMRVSAKAETAGASGAASVKVDCSAALRDLEAKGWYAPPRNVVQAAHFAYGSKKGFALVSTVKVERRGV